MKMRCSAAGLCAFAGCTCRPACASARLMVWQQPGLAALPAIHHASCLQAVEQYDAIREKEREQLEELEAARRESKAATEVGDLSMKAWLRLGCVFLGECPACPFGWGPSCRQWPRRFSTGQGMTAMSLYSSAFSCPQAFQTVQQKRYDAFMQAFEHVAHRIDPIYKAS